MFEKPNWTDVERARLHALRRQQPALNPPEADPRTRGERLADGVAATVGSWGFVLGQSLALAVWIGLNVTAWVQAWDPYPFILLNLVLSFQAAYTAPILMMSQNRQAAIDRAHAEHDYAVNVKAELEIKLLHTKIDALREQEIAGLTAIIAELSERLARPG